MQLVAKATKGKYGAGKHRRRTVAAIHSVTHGGFGAQKQRKQAKLAGAVERVIHEQPVRAEATATATVKARRSRNRPKRRWTEEQKIEAADKHASQQKQARVVKRARKWMAVRAKAKKEAHRKFRELATGGEGKAMTLTIEATMSGLLPPSMTDEAKLALIKTHADVDGDGMISFKQLNHFYVPVVVAAEADLVLTSSLRGGGGDADAGDAGGGSAGGTPTAEAILIEAVSIFAEFDAADVNAEDGVLPAVTVPGVCAVEN